MSGSDPGGDGAVRGCDWAMWRRRVDIQVRVEGCGEIRDGIQLQFRRGSSTSSKPGSKAHRAREEERTVGIEKGYYYDNKY